MIFLMKNEAFPQVTLRICYQQLESLKPLDLFKCVLFAVESTGPVYEDPISIEWRSQKELDEWLTECKEEGWIFTEEPLIRPVNPTNAERCRYYRERKKMERECSLV